MKETHTLVILTFLLLAACGGGGEKDGGSTVDKGSNASNLPAGQTAGQSVGQSSTETPADGSELFTNYRCFACHSLEGGTMYGPPLNGLYGKEISVVRQGEEEKVVADREYLIRAIDDPDYEKVLEYRTRIMTKPVISDEEIESIVDYLIGLGETE